MPTATFSHNGKSIDHIAAGALSAGDVIELGNIVGVVHRDAVAGQRVAVHIDGVFKLPIENTWATASLTIGTPMYWDATAKLAKPTADALTGDPVVGYITGPPEDTSQAACFIKLERALAVKV